MTQLPLGFMSTCSRCTHPPDYRCLQMNTNMWIWAVCVLGMLTFGLVATYVSGQSCPVLIPSQLDVVLPMSIHLNCIISSLAGESLSSAVGRIGLQAGKACLHGVGLLQSAVYVAHETAYLILNIHTYVYVCATVLYMFAKSSGHIWRQVYELTQELVRAFCVFSLNHLVIFDVFLLESQSLSFRSSLKPTPVGAQRWGDMIVGR